MLAGMHSSPLLFGILNVTADSFSDGGKYLVPEAAIAHGRELIAEGAHVLDVGPASSHPDARPVSVDEEIKRLTSVLPDLQKAGATISVDSYQTGTQRWALAAGADYLNDIQGFADETFYAELGVASAKLIVMHSIQGTGQATRQAPPSGAMVDHVSRFFEGRFAALEKAGVARSRLILDPGMGFFLGPTPNPSLEILRNIAVLKERFSVPVFVSVSRKSFLRSITGADVRGAMAPTLAAELYAALSGADMVRTHEPLPFAQALKVWALLRD